MWTYKNKPVESISDLPEGAFGFVYLIEKINPSSGEKSKYIGRKYLTRSKTTSKRVSLKNGTKTTKKKKSRVESDWAAYMGSCKPLLEEIQRLGAEKFKFTILAVGYTKGQVNFLEEYCQMRSGVMVDDSFYNDSIGARGFIGVKFTDEFKSILREISIR